MLRRSLLVLVLIACSSTLVMGDEQQTYAGLYQDISLEGTVARPLDEVLERIAAHIGLRLLIDDNALDQLKVERDRPVRAQFQSIRASNALDLVLEPLGLGYMVADPYLIIGNVALLPNAKFSVIQVIYNVDDLVPFRRGGGEAGFHDPLQTFGLRESTAERVGKEEGDAPYPDLPEFDELIDRITVIEPESWNVVGGGVGDIEALPYTQRLVISHTPEVHAQIRKLLEQLRAERAVDATSLKRKITIQADGIPLKTVLYDLTAKCGANLYLADDVRLNSRVTLEAEGPAIDLLKQILEPLKVPYTFKAQTLVVGTTAQPANADQRPGEAADSPGSAR